MKHAFGLRWDENFLRFAEKMVGLTILFMHFLVLFIGLIVLFQLSFTTDEATLVLLLLSLS